MTKQQKLYSILMVSGWVMIMTSTALPDWTWNLILFWAGVGLIIYGLVRAFISRRKEHYKFMRDHIIYMDANGGPVPDKWRKKYGKNK